MLYVCPLSHEGHKPGNVQAGPKVADQSYTLFTHVYINLLYCVTLGGAYEGRSVSSRCTESRNLLLWDGKLVAAAAASAIRADGRCRNQLAPV